MITVMGILLIAVILLVSGGGQIFTSAGMNKHWQSVAEKWHLRFKPGGFLKHPEIDGTVNGVQISAFIGSINGVQYNFSPLAFNTGGYRNSNALYTYVSAMVTAPLPPGLKISPERTLQKIGKFLGGNDLQIGDPSLDPKFIIQGPGIRQTRALLTQPAVRSALLQCDATANHVTLERNELRLRCDNKITNVDQLSRYISCAVELADAMTRAALALAEEQQTDAYAHHPSTGAYAPHSSSTAPYPPHSSTDPYAPHTTPGTAHYPADGPNHAPAEQSRPAVHGAPGHSTNSDDWW